MNACIFCSIIAGDAPAQVVYEDERVIAFLDKHPQSRGHLQLVPREHYRWIYDVPHMGELFTTAGAIIRAIIPVLGASHATIATYGKEVPHAHIWIVPQYRRTVRLSEGAGRKNIKTETEDVAQLLRRTLSKGV